MQVIRREDIHILDGESHTTKFQFAQIFILKRAKSREASSKLTSPISNKIKLNALWRLTDLNIELRRERGRETLRTSGLRVRTCENDLTINQILINRYISLDLRRCPKPNDTFSNLMKIPIVCKVYRFKPNSEVPIDKPNILRPC